MAFHSYTRLIRKLFNAYRFGPPSRVTGTSPWPSVDHLVSRLPPPTMSPCSGSLSLRLPASSRLTSPATATRRLIMQKARRHAQNARSDRLQAHGFRVSFTPLRGVLPTFPSRYLYTIGLKGVFSLAGWSRRIHAGFLVPRATQGTAARRPRSRKGLSPAAARLSRRFRSARACALCGPTTPLGRCHPSGLGSSPVARHYWGNHCCFLFLRVLRCFSSPRWPRRIRGGPAPAGRGVVPFGHLRVNGRLRLTADFRSFPRPSSPP